MLHYEVKEGEYLTLNIPDSEWKYKDWVGYIIENKDTVFTPKNDNMLKVYYIHSNETARKKLEDRSSKQGQFHIVSMEYKESITGKRKKTEYWMHELEPGLLIFFTSSTKEGYEKTLKQLIRSTLGLHEMWIKPDTFKKIRNDLVETRECGIIKFLADRRKYDLVPQIVTENAERHIQYRTDNPFDGINRLNEMEFNLGLTPRSIDYVYRGNRLQITNEGLFHVKNVTEQSFELMDYVIETIRAEERTMRNIAKSLKFQPDPKQSNSDYQSWILESGRIELSDELDVQSAKQIIKFRGFAFLEPRIDTKLTLLYSDVVDLYKGSLFGVSAFGRELILIPKYKVTFETFIGFYRDVVEVIDNKATWNRLSETFEH